MNGVAFLWPIARGVVSAVVGLLIGLGIGTGIAALTGNDPAEINITFGYLFGLIGWLLGIGVWDNWVREWIGRERRSFTPEGWRRYFGFSLDHKVIGVQYLVTFVILFLLAGIFALIMRLELADAGDGLIGPDYYNTIMIIIWFLIVVV
jgi:cytochrome c oxidase subunit 1